MNMKLVNAEKKISHLVPFMQNTKRVLDFGCGDLTFAQALHRVFPHLHITGVDVVDFGKRYKGVEFKKYDGKKLPFNYRSFDTVISWHVFHHTNEPFALLKECLRVAKRSVCIVEPVYRGWWDIPGMRCMDWVFNVWKDHSVSMPYAFASRDKWQQEILALGWVVDVVKDVELLPGVLPTGRSLLFICSRKS